MPIDRKDRAARARPAARGRGAKPRARRQRPWRKKFLRALAATSNVTNSCQVAGITNSHVYALRLEDAEFYAQWQVALCEGYDMLEMGLLCRLRDGDDASPEAKKKYDNGTAFRLLAAHRESAARQRAVRDQQDAAAVRASIDAKLEEMRERVLAARNGQLALPAPDHAAG